MDTPEPIPAPLCCDRCLGPLKPGTGDLYLVHVEAIADPYPPVFFGEDLRRDPRAEIERLVRELRHLSAQEALDQVYRRWKFFLCHRCYREWIEGLP
jgi:hypothetical protein